MVTVDPSEYGKLPDGRRVALFTLRNDADMCVRLLEYGAIVAGVEAPDRDGRVADVTIGYDRLVDWIADTRFMGGTIGRYANRIGGGSLSIDGVRSQLALNERGNHLHGGFSGFHKKLWVGEIVRDPGGAAGVRFHLTSPHGNEGYPGVLNVRAMHWLTADNTIRIEYIATTDQPTVVNLTHHSYWNLSGGARADILDHELTIHADAHTPVNGASIPTGAIAPVAGTPLDFTAPRAIGARIAELPGGYDHNFALRAGEGVRPVARLAHPATGRVMDLLSDAPGVQVYTSNAFDGSVVGKRGIAYPKHCAVALEAQSFPDSPHHAAFPDTVLRPGETYRRTIAFRFGVQ